MRKRTKSATCILTSVLIATFLVTGVNNIPIAVAEEIPYGGKLVVAGFTGDVRSACVAHSDYQYTGMGCVVWPIVYDRPWTYHEVVDSVATVKPPVKWFFTDWELSEDGLVWTVHIADNATFHDGEPVTAEDVKFTADTLCWMPTWEYASVGLNRTEVVDDYTVKFYMNCPRAYSPMDWTPILPKHIWEPYEDDLLAGLVPSPFPTEKMIGSGWFKLKEWKRDEYWWFEVNEDYWRGRPYIDELVFKVYASTEAAILALKTGEIDMWSYRGVPAAAARELMKDPNIKVEVCPGLGVDWLSVNVWENKTDPLARDVRVRKAIAHALDKDTIIDVVYLGYAEKADSWIYPELPSHNPNLPQYEYNLTKANEILDDAGYLDTDSNGVRNWEGGEFRFDLYTSVDDPSWVRMAELIRGDLEQIGIAVTVKTLDWPSLTDVIYRPDESLYDFALVGEEPGPVNEWMWEFALSYAPGEWNTAGWVSEEFDELYYAQAAEVNITKRDEIWWDMAALIAEDMPYIYLTRPDDLAPHRTDKFEGFVPAMGGVSSWVNAWSYYKAHLKEAPAPAAPAPSPLPWIIAGVCIVVAIGSLAYAVTRRPRPVAERS